MFDGPASHPRGLWTWDDWLDVVDDYEYGSYYFLRYSETYDEGLVANAYEGLVSVEYAERNGMGIHDFLPDDPWIIYQWNLVHATDSSVKMDKAWDYWSQLRLWVDDTTVAVLDSGIDSRFTDVSVNVVGGADFVDGDYDPEGREELHGTRVASVICSKTNNSAWTAGIGLDGGIEIKVMPVRIIDDNGDYTDGRLSQGILWAAQHGADVLNMSLSWSEDEEEDDDFRLSRKAVEGAYALKVVMCASNGNTGDEDNRYPACYPQVMGVAATNRSGNRCSWSTYNGYTSCAAPGIEISVPRRYTGIPPYLVEYFRNGLGTWGTSYACPHIAAACALMAGSYSAPFPEDFVEKVRKRVEGACDDTNGAQYPGWDMRIGNGRINMENLVLDILPGHEPVHPPPGSD